MSWVRFQRNLAVYDSWNHIIVTYSLDIHWRKRCRMINVWNKFPGKYMKLTLTIESCCTDSLTIPTLVTVKARFGCVQDDLMYQPWHKRCSLPPYWPYLVISSISPNNKVNTNYNSQNSDKVLFATSGWQRWQINTTIHTTMSPSECRQVQLVSTNTTLGGLRYLWFK